MLQSFFKQTPTQARRIELVRDASIGMELIFNWSGSILMEEIFFF